MKHHSGRLQHDPEVNSGTLIFKSPPKQWWYLRVTVLLHRMKATLRPGTVLNKRRQSVPERAICESMDVDHSEQKSLGHSLRVEALYLHSQTSGKSFHRFCSYDGHAIVGFQALDLNSTPRTALRSEKKKL